MIVSLWLSFSKNFSAYKKFVGHIHIDDLFKILMKVHELNLDILKVLDTKTKTKLKVTLIKRYSTLSSKPK